MTGLAFGVVGLLIGAAVGARIGYRRGVRATWLNAATAFLTLDRIVFRQLCRAEESARLATEREHDLIRNPRDWGNGAGYRSTYTNFPGRPVGVTSREINESAKAG